MTAKILKCDCVHEYQDKIHGKGKRVHNFAKNANNKSGGWRCTVCQKIKAMNALA